MCISVCNLIPTSIQPKTDKIIKNMSFSDVMHDTVAYEAFKLFLLKELCIENLLVSGSICIL